MLYHDSINTTSVAYTSGQLFSSANVFVKKYLGPTSPKEQIKTEQEEEV
jgi:hypothetical protein